MNPLARTNQKTVMVHVTQVELSKFQLEFNNWVKNQNLPTNDPFELLNDELLNAEQRDRVWSFLYLLGETIQN